MGDRPSVLAIALLSGIKYLRPTSQAVQAFHPAHQLTYNPAKIQARNLYTVWAQIFEGEQLRWTSARIYPVLTRNHPMTVELQVSPIGR